MPKSELFNLIKALEPAEKRYFKANNKYNSEKNYLRLFDAIDKQTSFDEQALQRQFKGEAFAKHLPSEMTYLQNAILKSMRSYHANNIPLFKLRGLLQDAEFLFRKGLYNKCKQVITKAKKLGYKHQHFLEIISLVAIEYGMLFNDDSIKQKRKAKELYQERHALLRKAKLNYEIIELYEQIFNFLDGKRNEIPDLRSYVVKTLNHPLLRQPPKESTFTYEFLRLAIMVNCHMAIDDLSQATLTNKALIYLLESRESMGNYENSYKKILFNYVVNNDEYKPELVSRIISKIENYPSNITAGKGLDFMLIAILKTHKCVMENDVESMRKLIPTIQQGVRRHDGHYSVSSYVSLVFNIITVYFQADQFSDCPRWIQKIKSIPSEINHDIVTMANLHELMVHLEISEPDIVRYIISNCDSYLKGLKSLSNLEQETFDLMCLLANSERDMWVAYCLPFRNKWVGIYQSQMFKTMGMENILLWVESKIQNCSLRSLAESRGLNKNAEVKFETWTVQRHLSPDECSANKGDR